MQTSNETSSTSSNEHQTTSSQVEVNHPETVTLLGEDVKIEGVAVNKGFEDMVGEAVKPKAQIQQDEQGQKQSSPDNLTYSPKAAADMALKGLNGAVGIVSNINGFEIQLTKEVQMIFAAMVTPLVMKHGKTIQGLLNPANVDLDSNVPEYLAVGAVAVVGIPAWLQIKEVNKLKRAADKQQENLSEAAKKARETGKPQAVETHGD